MIGAALDGPSRIEVAGKKAQAGAIGAEGADGGAQVVNRGEEIGGGLGGSEGKDGVGGYMFKEKEDVRVTIGAHGQVGRNVHVPLFAGAEPEMLGEGGFAQ
jgi:hypothetical protein